MDKHNQRDELFDQLKYGKIDPATAEAEARRLGLDPLQPVVDLSRFDPAREVQWTLPMAVAWIAYRSLDNVRNSWNAYREQCWDWFHRKWRLGPDGEIFEGWVLEQRRPETMARLLIGDEFQRDVGRDPKSSMTAREAKDALWIALKTDCFRATGVDQETGQRVQIVPFSWYELEVFEERGRDEVRLNALGVTGPNRYRDVLVSSSTIRGLWREPIERKTLTLPDIIEPVGDGYMPLTSAAQWIATEGGSKDFPADDVDVWRPAFELLLAAIGSDRVRVLGKKDGVSDPVPGHHFVDCPIEFPYDEPSVDFSDEQVRLRTYTYESEEEWRDGFSDALVQRGQVLWNRLMVAKADVLALWPFGLEPEVSSGLPGRPSSKHLYKREFERRVLTGEFDHVLARESEYLWGWLKKDHPKAPPVTPKSIANEIRSEHAAAKAMK